MLLSVENVSKSYGDRMLLDGISLYLKEGDRVGVVGVNGSGKSTLLKVAASAETPDSGTVRYDPNVRVSYLSQTLQDQPQLTVLEQVFASAPTGAREAEEYEAIEILNRLGIFDPSQKIGELSGGQRKRVALASALVHPADLLILDEPTNHLDAEMIAWLENFLAGFSGAVLMVTHDRYFLENTVSQTAEVSFGKLYMYSGGYSAYLSGKAAREEMLAASERKRQSILRRELAWVLQGPCARGTKSRERLERYESLKSQLPPEFHENMGQIRAITSRLGRKTVELENVTKAFSGRTVVKNFSYILLRDDRIGIIGSNGSGKTTLLNLIADYLQPDSGTIVRGDTVRIGYFSQHAAELNGEQKAIEYVKEFGDRIETADGFLTASKLMEMFLFSGDLQHRQISKLSGGEKRRLFLLGILASQPNVLLLDEPTNDLDIPTLQILEDYLETFPGAIIAVSHDRYFLDRICRRTFAVMPDGEIREFPGGYTDYREAVEAIKKENTKKEPRAEAKPAAPKSAAKLKFSFNEQREYETIEDDISLLEQQMEDNASLQQQYAADYVRLQELMEEESDLNKKLEEKMDRWVYLSDLAQQIEAQNNRK
ncbi:MAG: ABC-F family ATP-binding cassette domain-containing protein [Oscillospiraceae bacterium]|nr:ABC-F family ATP-binding cassette domain-containing protein [Oscillospiraceae bacterium]